jgi:hypothetical protein
MERAQRHHRCNGRVEVAYIALESSSKVVLAFHVGERDESDYNSIRRKVE